MTSLGLVPNVAGPWGGAYSINNAGQIVGYATNPNYSNAFLWIPDSPNAATGSFTVLPNPPGTTLGGRSATSINDSGVIVGAEGAGGGGGVRPYFSSGVFVWQPSSPNGGLSDLDNTRYPQPLINSHGQILAYTSSTTLFTPSPANDGSYIQTALPINASATALNDKGQVVGYTTIGT